MRIDGNMHINRSLQDHSIYAKDLNYNLWLYLEEHEKRKPFVRSAFRTDRKMRFSLQPEKKQVSVQQDYVTEDSERTCF